nr:MAG TPA: hypothetical protein [Caudoviricetes sp.]
MAFAIAVFLIPRFIISDAITLYFTFILPPRFRTLFGTSTYILAHYLELVNPFARKKVYLLELFFLTMSYLCVTMILKRRFECYEYRNKNIRNS